MGLVYESKNSGKRKNCKLGLIIYGCVFIAYVVWTVWLHKSITIKIVFKNDASNGDHTKHAINNTFEYKNFVETKEKHPNIDTQLKEIQHFSGNMYSINKFAQKITRNIKEKMGIYSTWNHTCKVKLPPKLGVSDSFNKSWENIFNVNNSEILLFMKTFLKENKLNTQYCLKYFSNEKNIDMFYYEMDKTHVLIDSKIVIMTPAKTGSSTMKEVISYLIDKYNIKYEHLNNKTQVSKVKFVNYLCNNDYKRIFFIRDPLERLLSGFLDKCTSTNNIWNSFWHKHCEFYLKRIGVGDDIFWKSNDVTLKDNDVIYLTDNTFDYFLSYLGKLHDKYVDTHFKKFTHFGGININDNFIKMWDFYDMKNENIWILLLKLIMNNKDFNSYEWNYKRKNEFNILCENEIKKKYQNNIKQGILNTNSRSKVLKYYGINELLKGIQYTKSDYISFNISLPDWICNITTNNIYSNSIFKHEIKSLMSHAVWLLPNCFN